MAFAALTFSGTANSVAPDGAGGGPEQAVPSFPDDAAFASQVLAADLVAMQSLPLSPYAVFGPDGLIVTRGRTRDDQGWRVHFHRFADGRLAEMGTFEVAGQGDGYVAVPRDRPCVVVGPQQAIEIRQAGDTLEAHPLRLPPGTGSDPVRAVSPGGRWLITQSGLWVLRPDAAAVRVLRLNIDDTPVFSGDRWVSLAWSDGPSRWGRGCYALDPDAGTAVLVPGLAWLLVSPDGRWARTVSTGGQPALCRLDPNAPVDVRSVRAIEANVVFSPDGQWLVERPQAGAPRLYRLDWSEGTATQAQCPGLPDPSASIQFSPDGAWLMTSSIAALQVFRMDPRREMAGASLATCRRGRCDAGTFFPDGRRFLAWDQQEGSRIYSLGAGGDRVAEATATEQHGVLSRALATDHDGHLLITGGPDNDARVWRWGEAGLEAAGRLIGHEGPVVAVDVAADGSYALTGSTDGTACVWRLDGSSTPCEVATLLGHRGPVLSVALSADGCLALTGGSDRTVRLWRLGAEGPIGEAAILDGQSPVAAVDVSPDGRWALSGALDGRATLWRLGTGTGVAASATALTGHTVGVTGVAFAPGGRLAATSSFDGTVRLWVLDGAGGATPAAVLQGHASDVTSLVFSADGRFLATGSWDSTVRVWQVDPARQLWSLEGASDGVTGVAFVGDDRRVLAAAADGSLRAWDLPHGERRFRIGGDEIRWGPSWERSAGAADLRASLAVESLDESNGSFVLRATAANRGTGPATLVRADAHVDPPDALPAFWIHFGTVDEGCSVARSVAIRPRPGFGRFSVQMVFSDQWGHAPEALSVDVGQAATAASGQPLPPLSDADILVSRLEVPCQVLDHGAGVTSGAFSPDGRYALTGCEDGSARLWRIEPDGRCVQDATLPGHPRGVRCVAISPDSRWALTGAGDGSVRIWRLFLDETGSAASVYTLQTQPHIVLSRVSFSPDGTWITARSGRTWLWHFDPATGDYRALGWLQSDVAIVARGGRLALLTPPLGGVGTLNELDPRDLMVRSLPAFAGATVRSLSTGGGWAIVCGDSGSRFALYRLDGDGHPGRSTELPIGYFERAFFSPDERRLLLLGATTRYLLLDPESGAAVEAPALPVVAPSGPSVVCSVAPPGHWVLADRQGPDARVLLLPEGGEGRPITLPPLRGHTAPISDVAISPDGRFVLTASADGTARLWRLSFDRRVDVRDGSVRWVVPDHVPAGAPLVAVAPRLVIPAGARPGDGATLEVAAANHGTAPAHILVANLASEPDGALGGRTYPVILGTLAPGESIVRHVPVVMTEAMVGGLATYRLDFPDQRGQAPAAVPFEPIPRYGDDQAFQRANCPASLRATASMDLQRVSRSTRVAILEGDCRTQDLEFTTDGRWLLAGSFLWNLDLLHGGAHPVATLGGPGDANALCSDLSSDGQWAIVRWWDVGLWRLDLSGAGWATRRSIGVRQSLQDELNRGWVSYARFSNDGRRILTCARAVRPAGAPRAPLGVPVGEVTLWEVDPQAGTAEPSCTLSHPGADRAAFSPDGRLVLTAGGQLVQLWELDSVREAEPRWIASLGYEPGGDRPCDTWSLDFVNGGEQALLGTNQGAWVIPVGMMAGGESCRAERVAYGPGSVGSSSADGRWVLLSEWSSAVLVEVEAGGRWTPRLRWPGGLWWCALSPDGMWAVSARGEGPVSLYRLFSEDDVLIGEDSIRWGASRDPPAGTPHLQVESRLIEGSPNGTPVMELSVTNDGDGPAHLLRADLEVGGTSRPIFFGTVEAGAGVQRHLSLDPGLPLGGTRLVFAEQWGHEPAPVPIGR